MIHLTKGQHDEMASNGKGPVQMIDPITNAEFVLVPAAEYAYLSGMIDKDFHVSDAYVAIDEAFAEGWNDPKMADYDHYEDFKK
jgi:hypothetical protein